MAKMIRITDADAAELLPYAHLNESQLQHYYEPEPEGIFIAESPNVVLRALDAGYQPLSLLIEEKYIDTQAKPLLERCGNVPVYVSTIDVLSKITGYHLTRGILGAFRRKPARRVAEVLGLSDEDETRQSAAGAAGDRGYRHGPLCAGEAGRAGGSGSNGRCPAGARRIAVLENIENPTNVGAIFRSAAALHMDAVLLTPGCADPLQRRAIRVSVGTVFQIPWTYIGTDLTPAHARAMGLSAAEAARAAEQGAPAWPDRGMQELKELGFRTAAMALRDDTISIDDPQLRKVKRLAILLGNEGDGLTQHTIDLCDYTIKIPMSHGVDSLNVAAASAVAFWELGRQSGMPENL